jgi:hypothetical protein
VVRAGAHFSDRLLQPALTLQKKIQQTRSKQKPKKSNPLFRPLTSLATKRLDEAPPREQFPEFARQSLSNRNEDFPKLWLAETSRKRLQPPMPQTI